MHKYTYHIVALVLIVMISVGLLTNC